MSLVGKLQQDYFLVLKFGQRCEEFSQDAVLSLVIAELLGHRSAEDADDELTLAGSFEGKRVIRWRGHKPEIRMDLVIKRPGWAERLDGKVSCVSLNAIFVYRVKEVSGL